MSKSFISLKKSKLLWPLTWLKRSFSFRKQCSSDLLTEVIFHISVIQARIYNAALHKNTSQSSDYLGDVPLVSNFAVDDVISSHFDTCASTAHSDFNVWWKVDLGTNYNVYSVMIRNRNYFGKTKNFNRTITVALQSKLHFSEFNAIL